MTVQAPPPVSIGVPVYNGEAYLGQALAALRDQEYGDIEVIVSDNASSDGTQEIVQEFVRSDPRFRYSRNEVNVGGARNSNKLLDLARGRLFKWAYADDVCAPAFVRRSVEVFEEAGPHAVATVPRVTLIGAEGEVVGAHEDAHLDMSQPTPHERLRALFRMGAAQVQFGLMRTDAARAAGGVSVSIAGEFVLPAALAMRGTMPLVPDTGLLMIREHPGRAGNGRRSQAAWVDPSLPRVPFPYSRATPLLLGCVSRQPLTSAERLQCWRVVARDWTARGWRAIAGDLVRLPHDLGLVR